MYVEPLYAVPNTGNADLNTPYLIGYFALEGDKSAVRTSRLPAILACLETEAEDLGDRDIMDAVLAQNARRIHVTCAC